MFFGHHRYTQSRWLFPLAVVMAVLLGARPASAHPLGNFTVNLYSRLEIGDRHAEVTYVLDMAEIPTYQVLDDYGGAMAPEEQERYLATEAEKLRRGLRLSVDGSEARLAIAARKLSFPPGQGGLPTLRMELRLTAALPQLAAGARREISYADTNYRDRVGWREIIARALPGAQISRSDVPAEDLSNALQSYPEDMLASPANTRTAHVVVEAGSGSARIAAAMGTNRIAQTDGFAALIATETWSVGFLLLALLLSMAFGALHALSPGHGKTIVGAYLVGARGTVRHALFLGLTVTITHTAGVFALGLITLYASQYILPEQLYPWLSVASGVLVALLGLTLLRQRIRQLWSRHRSASAAEHSVEQHHSHDHDSHTHHDQPHEHGPHTHTHLPPGADGRPITWRSLLALGISGGLVPCPSALIVMLSAISLGRVPLGLLLIVAFSVGLAGVLTGIGLAIVYGARWITLAGQRTTIRRLLPGLQLVPVAGALVVIGAGLLITVSALNQMPVFP